MLCAFNVTESNFVLVKWQHYSFTFTPSLHNRNLHSFISSSAHLSCSMNVSHWLVAAGESWPLLQRRELFPVAAAPQNNQSPPQRGWGDKGWYILEPVLQWCPTQQLLDIKRERGIHRTLLITVLLTNVPPSIQSVVVLSWSGKSFSVLSSPLKCTSLSWLDLIHTYGLL